MFDWVVLFLEFPSIQMDQSCAGLARKGKISVLP